MDRIEEIREKIGECDDIIIEQLAVRMSHIQEIISYKKATGIPILQPEQEKKQTDALEITKNVLNGLKGLIGGEKSGIIDPLSK